MQTIPVPLGIGTVQLSDRGKVFGFICESQTIDGARDITDFADWRRLLQHLAQGRTGPSADRGRSQRKTSLDDLGPCGVRPVYSAFGAVLAGALARMHLATVSQAKPVVSRMPATPMPRAISGS